MVFEDTTVRICYTNHRGETELRLVRPVRLYFGRSTYHQGEQWLMDAYDLVRCQERTFAVKDIRHWEPSPQKPAEPTRYPGDLDEAHDFRSYE